MMLSKAVLAAAACLFAAQSISVSGAGECLVTGRPYSVGASAAIVMEAETGTVLFAQNGRKRLPVASTTKILTALLTLEAEGLDTPFVADSTAITVEGSSMGLQKGDTVTLRALAGGMLTLSGNDAANAAAVRISESIPAFANAMNKRAAALGMNDSHFITPSGLPHPEHLSTAYDMALLAAEALKNPLFAEMCSAKRLSLSFGNPPYSRTLYNHNRLLGSYPPAIGIKTGFTREAGRCLVSAAKKDGITLIAVTLHCGDDWNIHEALYERYFPMVERVKIPPPHDIRIPVTGGTVPYASAALSEDFSVISIGGKANKAKSEIFAPYFLYAPIKKGDIVGKIVYYIDSEFLGECNLTAAEDVPVPAPKDMKKSKENKVWHRSKEYKKHLETAEFFPGARPRNMSRRDG